MDQKVAIKIEELAARFLNVFHAEMQKCDDDDDYINLIAGALVFKNLVIDHFKDNLLDDLCEKEIEKIVNDINEAAKEVSRAALVRIKKSKDIN